MAVLGLLSHIQLNNLLNRSAPFSFVVKCFADYKLQYHWYLAINLPLQIVERLKVHICLVVKLKNKISQPLSQTQLPSSWRQHLHLRGIDESAAMMHTNDGADPHFTAD